jgi:hypothetical protein
MRVMSYEALLERKTELEQWLMEKSLFHINYFVKQRELTQVLDELKNRTNEGSMTCNDKE